MEFEAFNSSLRIDVIELFKTVFSDSEGAEEGAVISRLVSVLIDTTPDDDLFGCVAREGSSIVGCIFFSRLVLSNGRSAFMLSPVAIATGSQKKGIGQALINYGIDQLRPMSVELVFTYGDPAYYQQVGFECITEDDVKAPQPLSQPIGWLAQTLSGSGVVGLQLTSRCVAAFDDPSYW